MISFEISSLVTSNNVGSRLAQALSNVIGIPLANKLGKYLGVPSIQARVFKQTYAEVVERVQRKLQG